MATIWYVRDGDSTYGAPARDDFPLERCIERLGLTKNLPRSELIRPPRFEGLQTDWPREPRHVVCEVDVAEALAHGWVPGFYRLVISPKEAAKRLGPTGVN